MTGTRRKRFICIAWASREHPWRVHHWHWPRAGIVTCERARIAGEEAAR